MIIPEELKYLPTTAEEAGMYLPSK